MPQTMPQTILIVEDNDAHARLIAAILKNENYACTRASSAEEALNMIAALPPDLVLVVMDLMLPGISGLEAIQRIRSDRKARTLPVIAVTSYGGDYPADLVKHAGADAYLEKPYSHTKLLEAVRALLPSPPPQRSKARVSHDNRFGVLALASQSPVRVNDGLGVLPSMTRQWR